MEQIEYHPDYNVYLPLDQKSERELAQWEFNQFKLAYRELFSWRSLTEPIGALHRFEDRIEIVRVLGEYRVSKKFTAAEALGINGRKKLAEPPAWGEILRQSRENGIVKAKL